MNTEAVIKALEFRLCMLQDTLISLENLDRHPLIEEYRGRIDEVRSFLVYMRNSK